MKGITFDLIQNKISKPVNCKWWYIFLFIYLQQDTIDTDYNTNKWTRPRHNSDESNRHNSEWKKKGNI